ncbi:MAG: iron ABC transporter permease [Myxococcaceae bacterium]|nr:iron ABC transporter permease [Myxococcaceae bacterium]
MPRSRRTPLRWLFVWLSVGAAGLALVPWYAVEDGFFSLEWRFGFPLAAEGAPALVQALLHGKAWLGPLVLPLVAAACVASRPRTDTLRSRVLVAAGVTGLVYGAAQGFVIGPLGESARQLGMGWGALLFHASLVLVVAEGLSTWAFSRPDPFVAGALLSVVALVAVFVVYPLAVISTRAFETETGGTSALVLVANLASARLWRVTFNTVLLGALAALGSTLLGLTLALAVARSRLRFARAFRFLSVLPIITPPFVIGMALIVAFGRAGAVTNLLGLAGSRYIYGLPGVLLAQLLAFSPVAFLILVDALHGVSPSMEEAAQTLRAPPWRTFRTVTLPLLRPALANAFLVGFVESLADFGNPLVLGGSGFDVLATDTYFAVAGAQADIPRAAAMALVLLVLTLGAFVAQQRFVGRASYTTVTGKGDAGLPLALPRGLDAVTSTVATGWTVFTLAVYALVLTGGFVKALGRDHTPTLEHFAVLFGPGGGGWSSLFTTVVLSLVAAPLTAAFALLTAWLLARQTFKGKKVFELATLLAFAVPGTVVGISYLLAFNLPPFDLVGTGVVLVLSFVFRNMPVGIRSGLAALSQLDPSLDEASLTLGASSSTTVRKVVLPLLKPTVVIALVYGFVRAMTAVSAVIFLVSAEANLSTTYILSQVESGQYGRAIAYSSVLILLMLLAVSLVQVAFGARQIGRRALV